jgi:DHA1 family tetracycline resistance protein-like MFS transporter
VTALLSFFALPETLAPEKRSKVTPSAKEILPFRSIGKAFKRAELRPLLFIFLLAGIPNTFFETNINVLAMDAIQWGPTIGLLISGIGVTDIIVKGGLLRMLLKWLGERGVILTGLAGMTLGCAVALVSGPLPVVWLLIAGGLLLPGAEGGMKAALQRLLANSVALDEQGWLAGTRESLHSAVEMIAPLLGGWLYSEAGHAVPYWIGVVMIIAAIFIGARSLSTKGGTPRQEEASGT